MRDIQLYPKRVQLKGLVSPRHFRLVSVPEDKELLEME